MAKEGLIRVAPGSRTREGQGQFKEGVKKEQQQMLGSLFCRICPEMQKVGCNEQGCPLPLEAHHVEPYKNTKSQDPKDGVLVCADGHKTLHQAMGDLSARGQELRDQFRANPNEEFYDVAVPECKPKKKGWFG